MHRSLTAAFAIVSSLLLAACGTSSTPSSNSDPVTISIQASDSLTFDPATVNVEVGQEVTFVVTNTGTIGHEFVLGPDHVQQAHEDAMSEGGMHGGMEVDGQLAALVLDPGATEEVTVTFTEAGEMPFACHVSGHFNAGMKGSVKIS